MPQPATNFRQPAQCSATQHPDAALLCASTFALERMECSAHESNQSLTVALDGCQQTVLSVHPAA